MNAPGSDSPVPLARKAREQFVAAVEACVEPMASAIGSRLLELVDRSPSTREAQIRRDAMLQFDQQRTRWTEKVRRALKAASRPRAPSQIVPAVPLGLELIGDDVVEKKIIASRLAMAIHEKATWELNDLKIRIQQLEGGDDFASDDILRPEALALVLIDQWMDSELPRHTWLLVGDVIQQHVVPAAVDAYRQVNTELVRAGVVPDVNLNRRVKRGASGPARRAPEMTFGDSQPAQGSGGAGVPSGWGASGSNGGAPGTSHAAGNNPAGGGGFQGGMDVVARPPFDGPSSVAGAPGGGRAAGFSGVPAADASLGRPAPVSLPAGAFNTSPFAAGQPGAFPVLPPVPPTGAAGARATDAGAAGSVEHPSPGWSGTGDAGLTTTTTSPMGRARVKAQGVIGQLKRLLTQRVAGFDSDRPIAASPALSQAISMQGTQIQTRVQERGGDDSVGQSYDNAAVQQVARELRERTGELKQQAVTSGEKAVIEIVALMFQSILAEERIPPAVRVWFARLQMPVLRVALAEPEFFGSLQHPARQLIDRMGSCVLGFDASAIGGTALEGEIRRVVQLIEQYPETGRKVFQLAFDEFQKFLSRFLTERGQTQRLVSVAQQVEQKETMAVRYTIELRKMLEDMPVRDEIREFLFKVWAEVMAIAAVKNGPQHAETLALKKSASELVWAASAKPNRAERAQVIQGLPGLLQRLRQGMSLLGLEAAEQEEHIKRIGDTLADAFQSKTAAIPSERIEAIAQRLANLEDFVGDDPEGDLPLVAESIELMLGIDTSGIDVITDGGATPNAAMLAWARELQPGTWFSLDHNGQMHQVQYAWRSERAQLHLFASVTGRSFLIQAGRLAAYLQAGLILPAEEEALTVRATRDALAKLDANPGRLFS
ncbi:DUF1631 family protein [Ramlibacter sp. AW1]|uniref:DUF1631 family protein n=1 Tax=Ramlibacter aurantiacus TaxID=2801330 RepID=A0A936ZRG1_9BURK|nr:DUF1631 family protein [Ramlibacter aurantiacus]MBL0421181.1 DUF1631 family protein [Ramlibacter aurantiacus]